MLVTRVSRRRQGGELGSRHHVATPSHPAKKPVPGSESFAWSSRLSVARSRKGPAPSRPLSQRSAQAETNRQRRGIGWPRELGAQAGLLARRREIAVSFFAENRTSWRGCPYIAFRCRSWWVRSRLQISSRHALQKQRSDESERVPSSSGSGKFVFRARQVNRSKRILAVAAIGHHEIQGSGWRHERHSAVFVVARRRRSRASLGVGFLDKIGTSRVRDESI